MTEPLPTYDTIRADVNKRRSLLLDSAAVDQLASRVLLASRIVGYKRVVIEPATRRIYFVWAEE